MENRFGRMMRVLETAQCDSGFNVDALAREFALTPATIRRYLRELRSAGALPHHDESPPPVEVVGVDTSACTTANDDASRHPVVLTRDELAAMHVGARFLVAEGDPATAAAARGLLAKVDHIVPPSMDEQIADLDALYSFPATNHEMSVRQAINQAIQERRVVSLRYRRENSDRFVVREVEPLAQFFTDDHWSFLAFCRLRQDLRTFCHDRCRGLRVTEAYFEPRQGMSLERFIQRRKAQLRQQSRSA